jgi:hypothetical protein
MQEAWGGLVTCMRGVDWGCRGLSYACIGVMAVRFMQRGMSKPAAWFALKPPQHVFTLRSTAMLRLQHLCRSQTHMVLMTADTLAAAAAAAGHQVTARSTYMCGSRRKEGAGRCVCLGGGRGWPVLPRCCLEGGSQ